MNSIVLLNTMASWVYFLLTFALTVYGAPENLLQPIAESDQLEKVEQDLKPASSSYSYQYSDWRGRYPGGYELSVIGNGIVDQQAGANYGDIGGYNNVGYGGSPAYNTGYGGYKGYDGIGQSGFEGGQGGYGLIGYGNGRSGGFPESNGYAGSTGFGANSGYAGNVGYSGNVGYGGNFGNTGNVGYKGNGGYGGYGGNSGLSSYYGYNNPSYQGNNHLGYGYYNKRPGYGNIYNNGITPSLVTGYRGYSR